MTTPAGILALLSHDATQDSRYLNTCRGAIMPEDTEPIETPITGVDADIAALKAQMSEMQTRYEQTIKDYQDANKQLFARIHAPAEEPASPSEDPKRFDSDKAMAVVYRSLGMKE